MLRYHKGFLNQLVDFDFETLENNLSSVYAVDKEFKLIYFNKAYFDFAQSNNGEPYLSQKYPLGSYLPDAIYGNIKGFYLDKLKQIILSGKSEHLIYECSSSNTYRQFMQKLYPLRNKSGIVIINSLNVESPVEHDEKSFSENYLQETGFINQCSNCRRTQSAINNALWDWVPIYISKMPSNMSHTICPICYDYYWKN
ncbi:MAG: hypothetical protein AB7O47_07415 [Flavobacteriales bacterium]